MTLIIKKPTGAKLVMRKTWQPMDPDAAAYITAVETADGQALEEKVKIAIDNFVLGCKEDGIWSAIKASCILAGARTLNGALVPLVGAAPTNFNFVSGDYNRKTGLAGDGSTKYLNSNRNNNADPRNSKHFSAFVSSRTGIEQFLIAGGGFNDGGNSSLFFSNGFAGRLNAQASNAAANINSGIFSTPVFTGIVRIGSNESQLYVSKVSIKNTVSSATPYDGATNIFVGPANQRLFSGSRLAFYSIGESLDLALLDNRVTDLINAIGAAIP